MIPAKPCSCLHSLSPPWEILLVNKHYQQKHNFATSTAALTERLSVLWVSSDTAHVILQAAEKVRVHLFCGLHAGLFINQHTSGPVCRHPVQKGPRETSSFAWCSFLSGQIFLKWKNGNHFRKGHMVMAIPFPSFSASKRTWSNSCSAIRTLFPFSLLLLSGNSHIFIF